LIQIESFILIFKGKITTIKINKDGKLVYSGSEDGSMKAFNIQTRQQIHHFQGIHESIIIIKPFLIILSRENKLDFFNS